MTFFEHLSSTSTLCALCVGIVMFLGCGKSTAEKGGETACSESVCNGGELSFAAGMSECVRETDGFIVPGSEKKGTCENATMTVHYEVCVDGKPEKRTRIDGC